MIDKIDIDKLMILVKGENNDTKRRRIAKGIAIITDGRYKKLSDDTYIIKGDTDEYITTTEYCDCLDFTAKNPDKRMCKHMVAVYILNEISKSSKNLLSRISI